MATEKALVFVIRANISDFNKALGDAERNFKKTFGNISKELQNISKISLGIGAAIVAPLALAFKDSTQYAHDIEILSDHWLDRLVEDSLPDDIGLSYPLNRTRNQLFYGGIIQNRQESLLNYNIDKLQIPTWAQFSCVLIKRKVIDDIGFLDSFNYNFAYFEDVDYCVRLTIKGYKMKLVKDVVVEHYQSVTAKTVKHEQYRIENRDKFYKKWNDRF